jgi:hypothetical protein
LLRDMLDNLTDSMTCLITSLRSPAETARDAIAKLIDEALAAKVTVTSEPRDEAGEDLTSLTSRAVDYPASPDEAAYYGLAAEIVRKIEPETEADPVALLFQLLAAFGNIIGRNAYMLADGTQHYLNLFIVLVGKTSKGRKGTAWRHVFNLMRHVAEEWSKNIGHGLSSGEGLIWAVRDKIEGKSSSRRKESPLNIKRW